MQNNIKRVSKGLYGDHDLFFWTQLFQDSITILGQVCCDSKGKLNAQSVVLEAGPEHGAQLVPVDLSELKEYSLFPGQVRHLSNFSMDPFDDDTLWYIIVIYYRLSFCQASSRSYYIEQGLHSVIVYKMNVV